jgi:hypothetical protein
MYKIYNVNICIYIYCVIWEMRLYVYDMSMIMDDYG